jgi:predicted helicase
MRNLVNTDSFSSILLSNNLLDINFYGFQTYSLPLYLYPDEKNKDLFASTVRTGRDLSQRNDLSPQDPSQPKDLSQPNERIPNLNPEIVNQIATGLGLTFTNEKEETPNTFAPIDLLDYIYAVLHSPTYREKYKEFLKIDFPRVPFPHHYAGTGRDLSVQNDDRGLSVQQKIQEKFWQLVKLGSNLRQIHLLESPIVEKYITGYPEDGDNVVTKPRYTPSPSLEECPKDGVVGNVYINDTQYFSNVPDVAWNFYIGGYQPAQKWLKDRKDRELSYEDILHYQKIIVALTETDRLMREIDEVEIE